MNKKEYVLIFEDFQNKIKTLEEEGILGLDKIHEAILMCRLKLSKLKKYTVLNTFENSEEEITFYKKYKGEILLHLIYYEELRIIEMQYPELSITAQKNYIIRREQKIKKFFKKHESLTQYVTLNLTNLDELFFTIKPLNESWQVCNESYHTDPGFYTNHDLLIAKIKALKKLLDYLKSRYKALENFLKFGKPMQFTKALHWTGSQTELTELIYALHVSKTINHGKVDIKEISQQFESLFNIKLNDIYRIYADIKYRQKSTTKFLDEMTSNLKEEIERSYR
ncbi:RteC domain-containing protein [uncultured Planktosalinus sp.]|uniref:RteC domain-containing protein n=1 Tax=uncultured Planktosalinus sp. TaxID=1810935 RepID=UPI0030D8B42D